ncbi:MAG: hypothetical protein ACTS3F_11595 [Phycisphaerales bacterium]
MTRKANNTAPKPDRGAHTAAERRTRYAATTIILLAASTIIALFAIVIAERTPRRFDLTLTRQHSLSQRTGSIIDRLEAPIEIVVSGDLESIPPEALESLIDLLEAFDRRSESLSFRAISTRAPEAPALLAQSIGRFAESQSSAMTIHRSAVDFAATRFAGIAPDFDNLADMLASLGEALGDRPDAAQALAEAASQARVFADEIRAGADRARDATRTQLLGIEFPQGDATRDAIAPTLATGGAFARDVEQAMAALEARAGELPDLRGLPESIRARAGVITTAASLIFDRLDRLDPLEPLLIARLLSSQQGVVLLSERGAAAIDFGTLFSATTPGAQPGAPPRAVRFNGEEAIANAISALSDRAAPIVVFVHAELERMLAPGNRPTPAGMRLAALFQRLALRRIEIAEWPVALQESRPDIAQAHRGAGSRPVVYVLLEAPTRLGLDRGSPTRAMSERATRIARLADTLSALIAEGANLMVSLEPSEMPAVGEPDPIAQALAPLGITPRVGTVLVSRISHPTQVVIDLYRRLRTPVPGHPISEAIAGLFTIFHVAMPIEIADPLPDGVRVWPLYRAEDTGDGVWGEGNWRAFRYANLQSPFTPISGGPTPPEPGGRGDIDDGPWTIAAAIERSAGAIATDTPQRAVVVAAPGWFDDQTTTLRQPVDARQVVAFPGNAELFDASLAWVAHKDELIAPGSRPDEISRIAMLTPAQVAGIRWGLILGVPMLILAAGLAHRVLRG